MEEIAVSIIVPVRDEADNLVPLVEEIHAAMSGFAGRWEALFVDDASTDGSLEVLRRLAVRFSELRILRLRRHAGQSAALSAGFDASRGRVVVTLDADLQNDPADIPRLLDALEGVDLVSGVRARRRDSLVRRISSRIANRVRDLAIHDGISDVGCSLKAYRRELLPRIPRFTGMHRFLPALLQLEGARVREVPVRHRPRRHGETKYNIRNRLWRGILDLYGVWWLRRRWIPPDLAEEVETDAVVDDPPPSA